MRKIGAWHVDHPTQKPDYARLFPDAVQALQDDYYKRNKKVIEDVRDNLLRYGTDDLQDLEPELRRRVTQTMETMVNQYGYCASCAKEAISFLARWQSRVS